MARTRRPLSVRSLIAQAAEQGTHGGSGTATGVYCILRSDVRAYAGGDPVGRVHITRKLTGRGLAFPHIETKLVISESTTRAERIDRQLAKAGWSSSGRQVIEELWLPRESVVDDMREAAAGREFVDYALLLPDERPIAVVEAKKSSRAALEGERQAADYADRIKSIHGSDPFVFLANGSEIFFWRRLLYPPRPVSGFFTRDLCLFSANYLCNFAFALPLR